MSDDLTARVAAAMSRKLATMTDEYLSDEDALRDALAECGAVIEQGWQPIETAPKDGTPVHLLDEITGSQRWAVYARGQWRDGTHPRSEMVGLPSPTHWRPLPDGPKP